jgi:hypothetical protein
MKMETIQAMIHRDGGRVPVHCIPASRAAYKGVWHVGPARHSRDEICQVRILSQLHEAEYTRLGKTGFEGDVITACGMRFDALPGGEGVGFVELHSASTRSTWAFWVAEVEFTKEAKNSRQMNM